jgi:hypothetical protein
VAVSNIVVSAAMRPLTSAMIAAVCGSVVAALLVDGAGVLAFAVGVDDEHAAALAITNAAPAPRATAREAEMRAAVERDSKGIWNPPRPFPPGIA